MTNNKKPFTEGVNYSANYLHDVCEMNPSA